jgi:AAA family ATP:ADP antiporter
MSAVAAASGRRRWHIAAGEGAALAATIATYFLLLTGYYMLRSLREAFVLEAGAARIPLLFTLTFVVMAAVLPLFWWTVGHVPRRRLLSLVYLPIAVLFAVIGAAVVRNGVVAPPLAATYFISVTALNLFIVSVFWCVMVDLWTPEAATRLFGLVAAGGSAGALVGPALNLTLVQRLGVAWLIFIACGLLIGSVLTGTLAQRIRRARAPQLTVDPQEIVGGRALDDLRQLVRSPYLLAIAGMIVAAQILAALMYNAQARYVAGAYQGLTERAGLFARIDFATNVVALILQSLVVGWLTMRAGAKATLSAMWILCATSFAALAAMPTGTVLLVTQVVRRAADYGLFKPAREMLFTVLQPASKFKSKTLLDTLLQRGADSLGSGIYVLLTAAGLVGIAWCGLAACLLLLPIARWLGAAFADRERLKSRSR